MWSDRFSNSGTAGDPANDPPGTVPVKTVSIGSHKDWSFAAFADRERQPLDVTEDR